jgi:hypothetical protein
MRRQGLAAEELQRHNTSITANLSIRPCFFPMTKMKSAQPT